MLFRNDLDELLAFDQYPAVSVYLPTHPAGREVRQDAIRLRERPMRSTDLLLGKVGVDQVRLGREWIPRPGGQDDIVS